MQKSGRLKSDEQGDHDIGLIRLLQSLLSFSQMTFLPVSDPRTSW